MIAYIKEAYIFTKNISNGGLSLLHGPPDSQGLHQLGIGNDQILPIDEQDRYFLFTQNVWSSDGFDKNLEIIGCN